jgi:hypothetical protein
MRIDIDIIRKITSFFHKGGSDIFIGDAKTDLTL